MCVSYKYFENHMQKAKARPLRSISHREQLVAVVTLSQQACCLVLLQKVDSLQIWAWIASLSFLLMCSDKLSQYF